LASLKRLRILWPVNWVKLLASALAMVVQAIRLSELADADGHPLPHERDQWEAVARQVAFEGRQVRRHLGVLD